MKNNGNTFDTKRHNLGVNLGESVLSETHDQIT